MRGFGRLLFTVLRRLPKNALSRWMGRVASLALWGPVQRAEIRLFAWLSGVDLNEARDEIEDFSSLQRFFTRALVPGARPIEGGERVLVSPCDGVWGAAGRIEGGTMLQVKGRSYRVSELLGDDDLAEAFEAGCYATFYLSPKDYHRFHTPAAGRITRVDHHPGALWPVNEIGLRGVDALFARNERVCAFLEPDGLGADAPLALVAVGATMVGSIRLAFGTQRTNQRAKEPSRREYGAGAPHFERGEEWGHFEFGSTIVLLTPPGEIELEYGAPGDRLRMGRRIGSWGGLSD